jgi:hypothetical protein
MKLPRKLNVFLVEFTLKSGVQLYKEFTKFKYNHTHEHVTSMSWTELHTTQFFIALPEITTVAILSHRSVIRWCHPQ